MGREGGADERLECGLSARKKPLSSFEPETSIVKASPTPHHASRLRALIYMAI